jgi:hypothetical protein
LLEIKYERNISDSIAEMVISAARNGIIEDKIGVKDHI